MSYIEGSQTSKCPICFKGYSSTNKEREPMAIEPCGHSFCRKCIFTHSSKSGACPFCERPIKSYNVNSQLSAPQQKYTNPQTSSNYKHSFFNNSVFKPKEQVQ